MFIPFLHHLTISDQKVKLLGDPKIWEKIPTMFY